MSFLSLIDQFLTSIINMSSHSDIPPANTEQVEESRSDSEGLGLSPRCSRQILVEHYSPEISSDIVVGIKPIEESLVLTLKISGELLLNLAVSEQVGPLRGPVAF